jgi:hypothetical protein
MTCYHLSADEAGDTYLVEWVFPVTETIAGSVQGVSDIPADATGIGGFLGRKPDSGLHGAPRRQFVLVLRGVLEVETSLGHREVLQPGDMMLADDVGTKGHFSRDVGDEPLMLMTVGIANSWESPTTRRDKTSPSP